MQIVHDNLWCKAPLKPPVPSVCSTNRDPISLKKHGIHVLLRFLQIWSCGKICHNYPGGVTPICFPGLSVHWHLICSQSIFDPNISRKTQILSLLQSSVWIRFHSLEPDNIFLQVLERRQKREIWLFCGGRGAGGRHHGGDKTLSGGKLPQLPLSRCTRP